MLFFRTCAEKLGFEKSKREPFFTFMQEATHRIPTVQSPEPEQIICEIDLDYYVVNADGCL